VPSAADGWLGGETALVTDGDLESRMSQFQQAIESRDVAAAAGFLHRDYSLCLVVPSSVVIPRAAWVATLPDYVVHEWSVQELQVEELGDVAAVLQRGLQRATVQGQPRDGVFVVSDVWLREGGVWRVWRRHSTPLTAPEVPTA
jgi:ketosteroid isomerase-like protein